MKNKLTRTCFKNSCYTLLICVAWVTSKYACQMYTFHKILIHGLYMIFINCHKNYISFLRFLGGYSIKTGRGIKMYRRNCKVWLWVKKRELSCPVPGTFWLNTSFMSSRRFLSIQVNSESKCGLKQDYEVGKILDSLLVMVIILPFL